MNGFKINILGAGLFFWCAGCLFGDLPLRPLDELETPRLDQFLDEHGLPRDISLADVARMDDQIRLDFFMYLRGDSTTSPDVRSLLEYLAVSLSDPRLGVWQSSFRHLISQPSESFTPFSRELIQSIHPPPGSENRWLSLYTAADIPSVLDTAREYVAKEEISRGNTAWIGTRILARYGDDGAIATVIAIVQGGDEGRKDWRIDYLTFPALINIKQPEAADVAAELLFSDEVVHQESTPPEAHVSKIGAWMLSQMVDDFPVEDKITWWLYTDEEIESLREWVHNRDGEWRIIDQRVNLRNNPEDFPWALEQQRLREARREAEERAWLEERAELMPDEEPGTAAVQEAGEINAEEPVEAGDEPGGRGIIALVLVLIVAAGAGAFLLLTRQR